MSNRGDRLASEKKKKAQVKKFVKECWYLPDPEHKNKVLSPESIGKLASAPKCCSCSRCCNPRKLYKGKDKLTIQERKHNRSGDE